MTCSVCNTTAPMCLSTFTIVQTLSSKCSLIDLSIFSATEGHSIVLKLKSLISSALYHAGVLDTSMTDLGACSVIYWIASWSPSQSLPLTVSYMCHFQSSSSMLPRAALIPPWGLFRCALFRMQALFPPYLSCHCMWPCGEQLGDAGCLKSFLH